MITIIILWSEELGLVLWVESFSMEETYSKLQNSRRRTFNFFQPELHFCPTHNTRFMQEEETNIFFFFPSGSYLYIKSMKWIWNPWKQLYSWNELFLLHSLSARKVIVNGQCGLSKKCEGNCFKLRNLMREKHLK